MVFKDGGLGRLKYSQEQAIVSLEMSAGPRRTGAPVKIKVIHVDQNKIEHILSQVKSFPGMPATAAKLMPLLQNPDANSVRIEQIMRYDPGLTANILKLTNSAYFGLPTRVSSVRHAIMLLGWRRLLQLVMTMCMSALMKKPVPGYDLPRGELWRHSVAVAVAANTVVGALSLAEADEVFTAALLHDIGKLVLGPYVQQDLNRIEQIVEKGLSFDVAEFIVLGTNHAEVGARILRQWALPQELVQAVSRHHTPESCRDACVLSDVVHVANAIGRMIGYGKARNGQPVEPAADVLARLGLTSGRMQSLADEALREVTRLTEMLA